MTDDDRKFIEEAKANIQYWSYCAANLPRLLSIIESLQARINELETQLRDRSELGLTK
jgi:hypothetical protein